MGLVSVPVVCRLLRQRLRPQGELLNATVISSRMRRLWQFSQLHLLQDAQVHFQLP
jgi:hypothetical protein